MHNLSLLFFPYFFSLRFYGFRAVVKRARLLSQFDDDARPKFVMIIWLWTKIRKIWIPKNKSTRHQRSAWSNNHSTKTPQYLLWRLVIVTCVNLATKLATNVSGIIKRLLARKNSVWTVWCWFTKRTLSTTCKNVILGDVHTIARFAGARIVARPENNNTQS